MKFFIDGDQMVFTYDDFVNLQESAAVFVPLNSEIAQTVLNHGFGSLPLGDLRGLYERLDALENGEINPSESGV